jgi:4'-phosphopantetheinyl transferase EntD
MGDPDTLSPREAAHLGRAVPKRAAEFAAGRHCAREALRQFGVVGWDLLVGADRVPLWPDGMVGSISHTARFCAAVVAERRRFHSLGLDVETDRRVTADLYEQFLTATERRRLGGIGDAESLATLIFSAKEAFYKAQYPLTGEWLEFGDIEIDVEESEASTGTLTVRPLRPLALAARWPGPWSGRFARFDGLVATGFAIQSA